MKKGFSLAVGALIIGLAGCSAQPQKADTSAYTTLGVQWVQNSGEYDALAYQAFNNAKLAFLKNKVRGKKNAVIVDLDETMIDNSAYAAWQVANHKPYSSATWAEWVKAKQAKEIPGAVAFSNFVVKHGGEMFYISNRRVSGYAPTVENLKALGFPQVDAKHLLLREKTSDKAARVNAVKAQGYHIALMMGDNLDDFGSDVYHKTNAERRAFVEQHKQNYGTKWIVLPNPNYGSFTRAGDVALKPWDGK